MTEHDEAGVRAAVEEFDQALAAIFVGDIAPMEALWSHADDVTYLSPAGDFCCGWAEARESWAAQAALKLGGKVESAEVRFVVGAELAISFSKEIGENKDAEGRSHRVTIRATNLFRKEGDTWKMIGHHADPLPFLEP